MRLKEKVRLFAEILLEELEKSGDPDIEGDDLEMVAENAPHVFVRTEDDKDSDDEELADLLYDVLERFEAEAKD